jgi:hypothetical protein
MIVLMLMAIALFAGLCVLAYTLAVYALPFMLGMEAAKWAYAVAGYAVVHGVTSEAVPSEVWRQIFCITGAGYVGVSALMRLAGSFK